MGGLGGGQGMESVMLTQTESDKESCEECVVFMFSVLG